ncbi:MAG: hypothetical protein J7M38_10620 [Armatimonadetes bacterium]|nr:hypothetical protein [Armatimonadota bacterium]
MKFYFAIYDLGKDGKLISSSELLFTKTHQRFINESSDLVGYISFKTKRRDFVLMIPDYRNYLKFYGVYNGQRADIYCWRDWGILFVKPDKPPDEFLIELPPGRNVFRPLWLVHVGDPTPKEVVDTFRIERDDPHISGLGPRGIEDKGDYWDFTNAQGKRISFYISAVDRDINGKILRIKFEILEGSGWFYLEYWPFYCDIPSPWWANDIWLNVWDTVLERVVGEWNFRGQYIVEMYVPDDPYPSKVYVFITSEKGILYKEVEVVEETG